jgi:hypothetical protein
MYARKADTAALYLLSSACIPRLACFTLSQAIEEAKRSVLESDKGIMVRSDACSRNNNQVRTKYRCWIDERGAFNELALA